jgi:hypothetical protein
VSLSLIDDQGAIWDPNLAAHKLLEHMVSRVHALHTAGSPARTRCVKSSKTPTVLPRAWRRSAPCIALKRSMDFGYAICANALMSQSPEWQSHAQPTQ